VGDVGKSVKLSKKRGKGTKIEAESRFGQRAKDKIEPQRRQEREEGFLLVSSDSGRGTKIRTSQALTGN